MSRQDELNKMREDMKEFINPGDEFPEPHETYADTLRMIDEEFDKEETDETEAQTYDEVMRSIEGRLKIALAPDMKLVGEKLQEIKLLVSQLERMIL